MAIVLGLIYSKREQYYVWTGAVATIKRLVPEGIRLMRFPPAVEVLAEEALRPAS
jgi:hypothetical protein